jgi:S1-C subfamily serine protease
MKYVLRPIVAGILGLAIVAAAPAQSKLSHMMQELNPLLSHSPGYLGVMVSDVDNETAAKQKLRDTHGAVVTLIDHDAPAGPVLRVNDVVLQVNGQIVEGAEQFSRTLRELPAGHKVTLLISRDGAQQTVTLELCDRKAMEQNVWNKMNKGESLETPPEGKKLLPDQGGGISGMHMHLFSSSLHVGAVLEPLTGQMADYLGVMNGVMVKHVDRKSEAEAAGLRPFDVILKVGNEPIKTAADWDRALRSNEGKSVQVTILRERRQQTVTLQVDSKRKN